MAEVALLIPIYTLPPIPLLFLRLAHFFIYKKPEDDDEGHSAHSEQTDSTSFQTAHAWICSDFLFIE